MSSVSQQPINDGDGKTGLYPYGYGLSYTTVPPTSTPPTSAVPTSAAPTSRPPTSRPPTSAVPTTTRPPTSAVPTSAVPTTTRPPTSAAPTTGSASCTVTYKVAGQWQGGFQGDVTIRNNGSAALSNWTLAWTYANGQTITQLWNASHTQSGSSVTVKGLSWNSTIAPSGTVNFGFLGSWTGTNAVPGSFTLNGSPCGVA
ncbi:cellulose binding domain-containing protein [Luedemannella flava]